MTLSSAVPKNEPWISRESLGVALVLVGQTLGWAVRGMVGGGDNPVYPVVPLVTAIGLLAKPQWLYSTKLYSDPQLLAIPILLLIVPYALLCLTDSSLFPGGAYLVFVFLLIGCVALTPHDRFRTLPRAVMVVGMIGSIEPLIELLVNPLEHVGRLASSGNSDVLITGEVGGITLMSAILVGDEEGGTSILAGLLASLAFTAGLGALILSDKRSDELILFAVVGVYLILRQRRERLAGAPKIGRQRLVFGSFLIGSVASLPALATVFLNKYALLLFEQQSESHRGGFFNSMTSGSSYVADTSTASRFATIEFAFKRLSIFGLGIMHQSNLQGNGVYTHLSYLQAYYDLGVLGGTVFLLVQLLLPAALAVLRVLMAPISQKDAFIILLWIYIQGDAFTHGVPYGWPSLTVVCLVYAMLFSRTEVAEDEDEGAEMADALPSS